MPTWNPICVSADAIADVADVAAADVAISNDAVSYILVQAMVRKEEE